MPMHFFRMLQMLTSFLENMGAGRHVLHRDGVGWGGKNIAALHASKQPVHQFIKSISPPETTERLQNKQQTQNPGKWRLATAEL